MKPHLLQDRTALECPDCRVPLQLIEFQAAPPVQVEHCASCHGMFFNPGELEAILDAQGLQENEADPEAEALPPSATSWPEEEVIYRPCPDCREIMHRSNFGGRSGVILGRCAKHGSWLNGSDLRRLILWWRVGGREIHARHAQEQPAKMAPVVAAGAMLAGGTAMPPTTGADTGSWGDVLEFLWDVITEIDWDFFSD